MKRVCYVVIISFIVSLFIYVNPAFAQDYNPLRKLARGVCNTLGGLFWELGYNLEQSFEEEGVVIGATYGVGKGILKGIGRTLVGALETVTFIFPFRNGYEPILDDPEFPFQIEKLKKEDNY